MAQGRTVLVLGGGVGGLVAANRLRRRLAARDRVVLVDRERHHLFQPSLLWLALGDRTAEQIQRPLERLARRGIDVVTGDISALDPERRRVRVDGTDLTGDALVVSLGAELAPESIPGLGEGGHNLYTLAGASALRESLRRFEGGRIVVLTAAPAYKCPAAPYEIAMLVQDHVRRRLKTKAVVEVYAAEPGPMATAGPAVSGEVRGMLEANGIAYHPLHQIERVDPVARVLHFTNATSATYDLLIYVPPHRAPAVVRESGLVGVAGWVPVDARTLETAVPGVFAIGDVTTIPIPSGKALPKAGVFAHREAEIVADNLAATWADRAAERAFDGRGACFIETGAGRAAFGSGDFYASPMPDMRLHPPARRWRWGKVAYEKYWLWKWF